MTFDNWHEKVRLHLLVNAWQEDNILGCILEHLLAKRSNGMPKRIIELHLLRNVFFVRILNLGAKILLQERVESDLILVASVAQILSGR